MASGAGAADTAPGHALGYRADGMARTYAKLVDRIRENPTKYLEELMG